MALKMQFNSQLYFWFQVLISVMLLGACNNSPDPKTNSPKPTNSQIQNSPITCSLDTFQNGTQIPQLAKAIYNNTHWDFSDNTASLALLDSLNTKNLASLPFYIKVIGLTYKKADGFYAETLGLAAKEFLENHTANFANCFSNKACFNNADLQDWAAMVIMELSLQADNTGNTSALMSYIKQIENNCKNCTSIEKETLQELVSILSKHWALR